jgi:hypothetical protein
VLAQQAQSPEFKPYYHHQKKKEILRRKKTKPASDTHNIDECQKHLTKGKKPGTKGSHCIFLVK